MQEGARGATDPRAAGLELLRVYLWTAAVTALVTYVPNPITRLYGHLVLAAAFLGTALYCARRQGVSAAHYGIDLSGVLEARARADGSPEPLWEALVRGAREALREFGFALLCAALIFPPYVVAFRLFHGVDTDFTLHLPSAFVDYALGQILVVALPEEALFRGYFQTRMSELWPPSTRVLGALLSLRALLWQAALFALLHFLVGLSPARLTVFFPALVFGWMRARRGGIGAAVWFHALSNLLSELLIRGYL
ncbi:MAG TPA: MrtC family glutamic-type intramembrane protease [Polyangiales bacterium]